MVAVGGIRYILASGDPKALDSARSTITYALIGLVIVLLSVVLVNIVGGAFGAGGLNKFEIKLQSPLNFFRPNNSNSCLDVQPGQDC